MNPNRVSLEYFLSHAKTHHALTTASMLVALLAPLTVRLIGWPGLLAAVSVLVALCAGAVWALRLDLEVRHLPLTLCAFAAFAIVSPLWSRYLPESIGSALYFLGFVVLAAYIALARDLIQILRSFATACRIVILGSYAVEVLVGIIFDTTFATLRVHGNLAGGGPIQGLFGENTTLGAFAVLALVTFVIELRARATSRWVAWGSIVLAVGLIVLSGSAIARASAVGAVVILGVLALIASRPPSERRGVQGILVVAVALGGLLVWISRWNVVEFFGAESEANFRLAVWRKIMPLVQFNAQIGRGFLGRWDMETPPYSLIGPVNARQVLDSSSTYIDVLFQLGLIGLILFLLMLFAGLIRAWLLAARRKSVLHQWPAVILTVLASQGLVMSNLLWEFGLLLLVICVVKVSHEITWRKVLAPIPERFDPTLGK
ncbi:O-antigen ligase family protein [Humidisolicoccus flavus]|uniref:O-antigen ligase family protein n=1 Tax=Humidisolicoccus flavus TaxID=3111414 RepID=UPI0032455E06